MAGTRDFWKVAVVNENDRSTMLILNPADPVRSFFLRAMIKKHLCLRQETVVRTKHRENDAARKQ